MERMVSCNYWMRREIWKFIHLLAQATTMCKSSRRVRRDFFSKLETPRIFISVTRAHLQTYILNASSVFIAALPLKLSRAGFVCPVAPFPLLNKVFPGASDFSQVPGLMTDRLKALKYSGAASLSLSYLLRGGSAIISSPFVATCGTTDHDGRRGLRHGGGGKRKTGKARPIGLSAREEHPADLEGHLRFHALRKPKWIRQVPTS